jgi:hypothetical protein
MSQLPADKVNGLLVTGAELQQACNDFRRKDDVASSSSSSSSSGKDVLQDDGVVAAADKVAVDKDEKDDANTVTAQELADVCRVAAP